MSPFSTARLPAPSPGSSRAGRSRPKARLGALRRLLVLACALSPLGLGGAASAQEAATISPALPLDRFHPAPAGDRMFGVQSPQVDGDLTPRASVLADYAYDPLVLETRSGERGAVVEHQMFMHLDVSLAVQSRVLFDVALPIALFQSGASPTLAGRDFASPAGAEIGDLRAGLRLRLLGEPSDPVQLALGGYLWFPTARSEPGSFAGEGSVRGMPQLIAGGRVADRLVWSLNAGADLRKAQTFGGPRGLAQGTMLRLDGGLGALFGDGRELQIGVEAHAGFLVDGPAGRPLSQGTNLEALFGVRRRFAGDFEVGAGVGPGMSMGLGTPDLRAIGMVSYAPDSGRPGARRVEERDFETDTDGDSIADARDACPLVQGVAHPNPALNGCTDSDDDGIFDPLDACPMLKGVRSARHHENGCPDTDADGVFDHVDACLLVRGVESADPEKNGCPDRDGDGVVDTEDACLTVPGAASAETARNGCPLDTDRDGVIDVEDACPDLAGLASTIPAARGCPGDSDGDTVRDDEDACPAESGKVDADPKKNGCPEDVRVTGSEIVLLKQPEFAAAKAALQPSSDGLLDAIAQVLREHPEIARVELRSHTDDTGRTSFNKALSQERAEHVRAALERRGVAASRIEPKGYGPDEPVADNKTEAGRRKNRRLQLVILEKSATRKP